MITGSLLLDLHKLPRGSKHYRGCDLSIMNAEKNPMLINLFKQKRIRGWYPFGQVDEDGDLTSAVYY